MSTITEPVPFGVMVGSSGSGYAWGEADFATQGKCPGKLQFGELNKLQRDSYITIFVSQKGRTCL